MSAWSHNCRVRRSGAPQNSARLVPTAFCAVVLVLLCTTGLQAHEIGTTFVSVTLHSDRSYRIEITTDAESLAEKFSVLTGQPANGPIGLAALRNELPKHDDLFRRRLSAAFGGNAVHPAIEYAVLAAPDPSFPPRARIKLTGMAPGDARDFSWTYSWTFATYALTVRRANSEQPVTEWLEGGQASSTFSLDESAPPPSGIDAAARYLVLGFTHIVPKGLDHMLFVLGIFLLGRGAKQVLWQVSAFTIAHSITLALSIYGALSVSAAIVEPLIAVSIAYVAIENMVVSDVKPWRVALVFAFGLLHGMGFAGALKELGLPPSEFLTALVAFNVGVEAGQLAVVGTAFVLVGWYGSGRPWYRRRVVVPASALIACAALYWTVDRL